MKTIEINLYKFSELSEEAKQTAIQNKVEELERREYSWGDDAINTLEKLAEHFNCSLKNYSIDWGCHCQSSYSFDIPYYVQDWTEEEIKTQILSLGKYNPETLSGLGECVLTGVCFDEDAADGVRDVEELLNAGAENLLMSYQKDYEYQCSEEYAQEELENNDCDFTEDGEIYEG